MHKLLATVQNLYVYFFLSSKIAHVGKQNRTIYIYIYIYIHIYIQFCNVYIKSIN